MEKSKEKYSLASKARWAKRTPEQRSKMMRAIVIARWKKAIPEAVASHMQKMRDARKLKQEMKKQGL